MADTGQGAGFLSEIDESDRYALFERGRRRQFPPGVALFHQRQIAERVLILLSGRVKIAAVTDEGREAVLGVRGPGDLLGELSALDERPYSASVISLEEVEGLALSTAAFRGFIAERPGAMLVLFRMLASRLRDADAKLAEFIRFDTVGRVAARILQLADSYGTLDDEGHVQIDLPLTQDELAGWTGASREAVGRALGTLRDCGWVQTARRQIIVNDVAALQRLVS